MKIRELLKTKAPVIISISALLCFLTFITNLFHALKDGIIDCNELHTLLASADGFETVVLFLIALALKQKKK